MLEVVSEHGVFVVLSQASLVVRIRKVGSQQDEGSTKSSCFLLFTSDVQPRLVKECPRRGSPRLQLLILVVVYSMLHSVFIFTHARVSGA